MAQPRMRESAYELHPCVSYRPALAIGQLAHRGIVRALIRLATMRLRVARIAVVRIRAIAVVGIVRILVAVAVIGIAVLRVIPIALIVALSRAITVGRITGLILITCAILRSIASFGT